MPAFLNLGDDAREIALTCAQLDPHLSVKLSIFGFMILALWVLYRASCEGRDNLATYLMGFCFGYSIEALNTYAGNYCYQYGPEWSYLPGQVPLYVSCGWAMIFYAAYYTSLNHGRGWLSIATLSGFLALSLDLVLDPGTVALGLWQWLPPTEPSSVWPWFSVPWSNFVGWFLLIFSLATAQYLLIDRSATDLNKALPWLNVILLKLKVMALAYTCFALLYYLYSTISQLFTGLIWQTLLHSALLTTVGFFVQFRIKTFSKVIPRNFVLLAVPCYLLICASLYLLLVVVDPVYQPLVFVLPLYSIVILMLYDSPYRKPKYST